jgi:hypothetical protein
MCVDKMTLKSKGGKMAIFGGESRLGLNLMSSTVLRR